MIGLAGGLVPRLTVSQSSSTASLISLHPMLKGLGKNPSAAIAEAAQRISKILETVRPDTIEALQGFKVHVEILTRQPSGWGRDTAARYSSEKKAVEFTAAGVAEASDSQLRNYLYHELLGHALLDQRQRAAKKTHPDDTMKAVQVLYADHQLRARAQLAQALMSTTEKAATLPPEGVLGKDLQAFYSDVLGYPQHLMIRSPDERYTREQADIKVQNYICNLFGLTKPTVYLNQERNIRSVSFIQDPTNKYRIERLNKFKCLGLAAAAAGGAWALLSRGSGGWTLLGGGLLIAGLAKVIPHLSQKPFDRQQIDSASGEKISWWRQGHKNFIDLAAVTKPIRSIVSSYAVTSNDAEEYLCEGVAAFNEGAESRQRLQQVDVGLYTLIEQRYGLLTKETA